MLQPLTSLGQHQLSVIGPELGYWLCHLSKSLGPWSLFPPPQMGLMTMPPSQL